MQSSDELVARLALRGVDLWVEAENLRFRCPDNGLPPMLLAQLREQKGPIVAALSDYLRFPRGPAAPVFAHAERPSPLPIVSYHRTRWESIKAGTLGVEFVNSTHFVVRIREQLDLHALAVAIATLAKAHVMLTARVVEGAVGPCYEFGAGLERSIRILDLPRTDPQQDLEHVRRIISNHVWAPFGESEPWFRVFVATIDATDHIVGFVVHHFVADGWSVSIMARQLLMTYDALVHRRRVNTPPAPLEYSDYVTGMNTWLDGSASRALEGYWRRALRGASATRVPKDRDCDPDALGEVHSQPFRVGADVIAELRRVLAPQRVFMHATVMAAIVASLVHATGTDDVLVVTRVSGRVDPRLFGVVGAFLDAVPIRLRVSLDASFSDLAERIQTLFLYASECQFYPYQRVKALYPDIGAAGVAPMINFIEERGRSALAGFAPGRFEKFELCPRPVEIHSARRYSSFYAAVSVSDHGLRGQLDYLSLMYDPAAIADFTSRFCLVLERAVAGIDRPIRSILDAPGGHR